MDCFLETLNGNEMEKNPGKQDHGKYPKKTESRYENHSVILAFCYFFWKSVMEKEGI